MARWGRLTFSVTIVFVLFISCILLLRTLLFPLNHHFHNHNKFQVSDVHNYHDFVFEEKHIENLRNALRFRSISWEFQSQESQELLKLQKFIYTVFPTIHSSSLVQREVVNKLSLLYTIKGQYTELKPYLLMGHLDVVPVEEELWDVPPFDGVVKDGYIYGRGAMDAKHIVMGIMEALEILLKNGFQPKRSFYLAFGHDEEIGGINGAKHISKLLESRNVHLQYLLDEGMIISNNMLTVVDKPVALIGVTEKGSLTANLYVNLTAGHSSAPPFETSIGVLAKAVSRLESAKPPCMFGYGPEKETMLHLIPHVSLPLRIILSNLWLFSPLVGSILSLKSTTNALIRTTCVVTIFKGGFKLNVIPSSANATVNCRIHPSQTVEEIINWIQYIINDNRVQMQVLIKTNPHPVSPSSPATFGYQIIQNSIQKIFPTAIVVPSTLIANTDTQHYLQFTDAVYRFSPLFVYPLDVFRIHGNNERISIENYKQVIQFYYELIINSDVNNITFPHEHSGEL